MKRVFSITIKKQDGGNVVVNVATAKSRREAEDAVLADYPGGECTHAVLVCSIDREL